MHNYIIYFDFEQSKFEGYVATIVTYFGLVSDKSTTSIRLSESYQNIGTVVSFDNKQLNIQVAVLISLVNCCLMVKDENLIYYPGHSIKQTNLSMKKRT